MKIENIKDLEAIIKLCRKQGIESIKVDGVELNLGAPPAGKGKRAKEEAFVDEASMTEEQMLYWSTGA